MWTSAAGSCRRLLNAINVPSGDQAGSVLSWAKFVIISSPVPSTKILKIWNWPGRVDWNAICDPSGCQLAPLDPPTNVRRRGFDPSAFMIQISVVPERLLSNAISRPSGEYLGRASKAGLFEMLATSSSVPLGLNVKISLWAVGPDPTTRVQAIFPLTPGWVAPAGATPAIPEATRAAAPNAAATFLRRVPARPRPIPHLAIANAVSPVSGRH